MFPSFQDWGFVVRQDWVWTWLHCVGHLALWKSLLQTRGKLSQSLLLCFQRAQTQQDRLWQQEGQQLPHARAFLLVLLGIGGSFREQDCLIHSVCSIPFPASLHHLFCYITIWFALLLFVLLRTQFPPLKEELKPFWLMRNIRTCPSSWSPRHAFIGKSVRVLLLTLLCLALLPVRK